MVLKYSSIASLLFVLATQGYPIVAGTSQLLGVSNTPLSLAMRVTIVVLSLLVLVSKPKLGFYGNSSIVSTALLAFWAAYLFRLMIESAYHPQLLVRGASYYWMWAIGSCLVPMLAILLSSGFPRADMTRLFRKMILALFAAICLIILNIASTGMQGLLAYGRLQLESLNPISMGHTASIFALFGVILTARRRRNKRVFWRTVLGVFMVTLGAAILLATGSRGAQLSFISALAFFLLSQPLIWSMKILAALLGLFLAFAPTIVYILETQGITALTRIDRALEGQDDALLGREVSYVRALDVFLEHPAFGQSIGDPVSGAYPHNIILEAMMATGLVGSIPLVIALFGGVHLGWRMLRRDSPASWLAVFYVESLTGAMFSGAVYNVSATWVALAGVVALSRNGSPRKR